MDDTAASPAAATAAGCDAARDKTTNAGVAVAAAAAASSTSVRLLIKSSNQQYDDMNVDSDLSWTVQRLKKQLSLVYPGKPDINDQKLIYSGKLLDDAQKLSEVIRSYKDVYQQHHIFHLVCANKHFAKPPAMPTAVPKNAAPRQEGNLNASTNEIRQRHASNQQQQPPLQLPQQQAGVDSFLHGDVNNLAFRTWYPLWLQQQQAATHPDPHVAYQQRVLLYNAWMSQVYDAYLQDLMRGAESPPGNRVPLLPNMLPQWELQAQQQMAAHAAASAAAAQQNPAPVAQPAEAAQPAANRPNFPLIQVEPENRDWLDSFFSFTRLAIFVTVLYFNSSPLRCLLVMFIAGVIYLYHIGVLRRRRERNNNNINRNNNAGHHVAAFAAVQQIQRMMDAVERENNDPQAAVEPVAAGQDAPDAPLGAAADAPADPAAAPAAAAPAAPVPASAAGPEQAAAVSAEAAAVEPPNANNSVISAVRTFVITFFTSLLPEAPAL
ncbi:homocysteine-responsive endoplasmic reticulum-resident ubiquitin-like domain member 2 protein [Drosophila miranda]|uniref:homocysteine-responsive endoplasmic reticulum-resident ubiquitin-like domain member 2 protein n=1 Tax=Drosophila miranda TaxID=7229 RepID=UPI00143F5C9C|nr:homocysteine-responsive endoplasmic reticulum-resident ubiquitin-like domain member 2 protein [Drosophila miranda]